jgi:hypothetical protein
MIPEPNPGPGPGRNPADSAGLRARDPEIVPIRVCDFQAETLGVLP